MAAISANRQVIAASVSRNASPRLFHISSQKRATALSDTHHAAQKALEITLQPVFAAPTRMPAANEFMHPSSSTANSSSASSYTVTMFPPTYPSESERHPTTLPAPVLFDGPARKDAAIALKARMRHAGLAPSISRQSPLGEAAAVNMPSTQTFATNPQVEMVDGHARISRWHK